MSDLEVPKPSMPSVQEGPSFPRAVWMALFESRASFIPLGHLLVFAFYVYLASGCLSAAIPQFETHLIGAEDSDVLRNVWGYGWVKSMVVDRLSFPRFTTDLNYPSGMTILIIDLLGTLVSLPFQLTFGMPEGYNLYILATLAFNAWGGFALAAERSRSPGAGLVAGAVFGLCPYVLSTAVAGNSELVNVGWMALYLRAYLRIVAPVEGAPMPRRPWFRAGLLLIATTLSCWYYGYIVGLASVLLALLTLPAARLSGRRLGPVFVELAKHYLLFGLFSALMIFLYRDIIPNLGQAMGDIGAISEMTKGDSVRLWELLQPENSRWVKPILFHLPLEVWGAIGVASLVALPRSLRWAPLVALFLLLSLGLAGQAPLPNVHLEASDRAVGALATLNLDEARANANLQTLEVFAQRFYLAWRDAVPFAEKVRFPSRHMTVVYLSLAVMLALGLGRILTLHRLLWAPGLVVGVAGALWVTQAHGRVGHYDSFIEMTEATPPEWARRLADDPEPGAVVQLPVAMGGGKQIFYQTYHHRPLMAWVNFVTSSLRYIDMGGGSKTLPMSFLDTIHAANQRGYDVQARRFNDHPPRLPGPARAAEDVKALAASGFRYLIIDSSLYKLDQLAEILALLEPHLSAQPPDGDMLIYLIPPAEGE